MNCIKIISEYKTSLLSIWLPKKKKKKNGKPVFFNHCLLLFLFPKDELEQA